MKVCLLQHWRKLPLDFADTVGYCPLLLNCTEQYLSQQKVSFSVASDSQFSHLGRDISATLDGNFRRKDSFIRPKTWKTAVKLLVKHIFTWELLERYSDFNMF